MRSPSVPVCVVAAAVVMLVLVGCGQPTGSSVSRAIERELPRVVGPAQSYNVDVQGIRGDTYAESVTATGKRVHPSGSPVLDTVEVELKDVTYDPTAKQVQKIGSAKATISVLPEDVADYLAANRNMQDVTVTFDTPDRVTVRLRPKTALPDVPPNSVIDLSGSLAGEDSHVNFQITQFRTGGVDLPAAAADQLDEVMSPLIDLSSMPIALDVAGVHVEEGVAVVQVTGEYPPAEQATPETPAPQP